MRKKVVTTYEKKELLSIALELLMESNDITVKGYGVPVSMVYSTVAIKEAQPLIKVVNYLISKKGTDIQTIGNEWVNNGFIGSTKTINYLLSK